MRGGKTMRFCSADFLSGIHSMGASSAARVQGSGASWGIDRKRMRRLTGVSRDLAIFEAWMVNCRRRKGKAGRETLHRATTRLRRRSMNAASLRNNWSGRRGAASWIMCDAWYRYWKEGESEVQASCGMWKEACPGFKAIGVLGSDVYDKLLILQALKQNFPHAIFFTTDLDARLFPPREIQWTR